MTQNLSENWFVLPKTACGIWKIFNRDSFLQSRKCLSLKFTGKLCVMRMMQNWKRNWLFVSKLTWRILTRALKSLKHLHFNGIFLIKVYNVWAKQVQKSYVWWHWRLMQNVKENWLVLSKMAWRIWQILVSRLKNSDFILENKIAELNQNQNSKHTDQPNAVWKHIFP